MLIPIILIIYMYYNLLIITHFQLFLFRFVSVQETNIIILYCYVMYCIVIMWLFYDRLEPVRLDIDMNLVNNATLIN